MTLLVWLFYPVRTILVLYHGAMRTKQGILSILIMLLALLWACEDPCDGVLDADGVCQPVAEVQEPRTREPCASRDALRTPFFGDLHVHTRYSLDASVQGNRVTPVEAYRFAQGETLGIQPYDAQGEPTRYARLERPLDFAMVSDHAEFFGENALCHDPTTYAYNSGDCETFRENGAQAFYRFNVLLAQPQDQAKHLDFCGEDGADCMQASATVWGEMVAAAEEAYDRTADCSFTSFVGYEWSGGPGADALVKNLHRNIVFANEIVPEVPASYLDYPWPEQLWSWLKRNCVDGLPYCDVLSIPHNSNLSAGRMFETVDRYGNALTDGHTELRTQFETLVEVIQHKGQSECMPGAAEEACGFAYVPWNNLAGSFGLGHASLPTPASFVRGALRSGLTYVQAGQKNPFPYGMIGSTDTHLGTPGLVREKDYPGHGGAGGGAENVGEAPLGDGPVDTLEFNPGGLAVVWAEENSRSSLFAAMKRREVYATSGSRIVLRMFAGDLDPGICAQADWVASAYETAVPMGGELQGPRGKAPVIVVAANQDPGTTDQPGIPLQSFEIVKAWVSADGTSHEQVYAIGGTTQPATSLDLATCTVQNRGAGLAQGCFTWQDPAFDPTQPALYYARVLEEPSCRWNQWQCIAEGITCTGSVDEEYEFCCDDEVPKAQNERAWSSPIWYLPSP